MTPAVPTAPAALVTHDRPAPADPTTPDRPGPGETR
ncbi:hypothetical protein J2S51_003874 [Streptomyces sp. DSM 41269]|nr:hypothetical protein [Streptomyces sp. DSM 41269]